MGGGGGADSAALGASVGVDGVEGADGERLVVFVELMFLWIECCG